jgi:chromate transporter
MTSEPEPTPLRMFLIFSQIGLTSFGGGLSGWMLRAFVRERKWMSEEEFLNGLALSQALPGVNVTNMGIWIGYRLCGTAGAIAAVIGVVVPPTILMVLLAIAFAWLQRFPVTHLALDGAAAAAIGLSGWMGITTARRVPRRAIPLAVMAISFVLVAWLRVSLVWVVVLGGAASVALEYIRLRNDARTHDA